MVANGGQDQTECSDLPRRIRRRSATAARDAEAGGHQCCIKHRALHGCGPRRMAAVCAPPCAWGRGIARRARNSPPGVAWTNQIRNRARNKIHRGKPLWSVLCPHPPGMLEFCVPTLQTLLTRYAGGKDGSVPQSAVASGAGFDTPEIILHNPWQREIRENAKGTISSWAAFPPGHRRPRLFSLGVWLPIASECSCHKIDHAGHGSTTSTRTCVVRIPLLQIKSTSAIPRRPKTLVRGIISQTSSIQYEPVVL